MFSASKFLDLEQTEHASLFQHGIPLWSTLPNIGKYIADFLRHVDKLPPGDIHDKAEIGPQVFVAEGAVVEAHAVIKGPAIIGKGTTVRSGAYVRENVIAGDNCMLGNSSEFKNCILFNNCEVPHFNYVGDSILGYKAHLGAGVICSNVRLDRRSIRVRRNDTDDWIDTGLRKFGAIIGDRSEVGCNSVLSPGSILGRDCIVHPCTHWQGVLGENQIVKNTAELQVTDRD